MIDELCGCCDYQIQAAVDAIVDDTDYCSKGVIIQINGMCELVC